MSGSTSRNPGVAAADPNSPEIASILKSIPVGGLTPFTTIDYPGRLAGVFYLQGCPWRCRYCYNSELWKFPSETVCVPPEKILDFLKSRRGRLDGIVFSGGEPTAHAGLKAWMTTVKSLGYEVALHTGGIYPDRLKEVLPVCDWVGLDVKAPFREYDKITNAIGSGENVRRSAELLFASKVPCECRTTVHPALLSELAIQELAAELATLGCRHYVLQKFRAEHCPDKELREADPLSFGISDDLRMHLQRLFPEFKVRE